jgi:hypothetical protein
MIIHFNNIIILYNYNYIVITTIFIIILGGADATTTKGDIEKEKTR